MLRLRNPLLQSVCVLSRRHNLIPITCDNHHRHAQLAVVFAHSAQARVERPFVFEISAQSLASEPGGCRHPQVTLRHGLWIEGPLELMPESLTAHRCLA